MEQIAELGSYFCVIVLIRGMVEADHACVFIHGPKELAILLLSRIGESNVFNILRHQWVDFYAFFVERFLDTVSNRKGQMARPNNFC